MLGAGSLAAQPKDLNSNCHDPHQTTRRGPTHLQPQFRGKVEAGRSLGEVKTGRFLGLAGHQFSNRFSERPVSREQGESRAEDISSGLGKYVAWAHTYTVYIHQRQRQRELGM